MPKSVNSISLSLISVFETVKFQVLISCIPTEYGDLQGKTFYSVQLWGKRRARTLNVDSFHTAVAWIYSIKHIHENS